MAAASAPPPSARITEFLRSELAPSPARWRATGRVTAACLATTALVMALHVPHGGWAVWSCLLVSLPDAGASLLRGFERVLGTMVGAGAAVAVLALFPDEPWFRLPLSAAAIGLGLFFFRTSARSYVSLLAAITVAILIGLAGDDPARVVDDALWRSANIALGVAIATAANVWLWPADPEQGLRAEMADALDGAAGVLQGMATPGDAGPPSAAAELRQLAFDGPGRWADWVTSAERLHPRLRTRHGELLTAVTSVHRIATATATLAGVAATLPAPGPRDRARLQAVARDLHGIADALRPAGGRAGPAPPEPGAALRRARAEIGRETAGPSDAFLLELEAALGDLEASLGFLRRDRDAAAAGDAPAGSSGGDAGPVAPGAVHPLDTRPMPTFFTPATNARNRPAVRFATRGALAAAISLVLVEALHWPGIGTSVVTSVVISQGSLGASVQKAALRLAGAVVGGALALAAIVLAMPDMEGLPSLLVVSALPLGLAAYVLAGSPRSSYAGIQIGLAWGVAVLATLGPTVDLEPPRDRVLGILLGIGITLGLSRVLWPERASQEIAGAVAAALRHLGGLARVSLGDDADDALRRPAGGYRWQLGRDFADAIRLDSEARYEPGDADARRLRTALLAIVPPAQATSLSLLAVVRHRLNAGVYAGPAEIRAPLRALAEAVPLQLDAAADRVEQAGGAEAPPAPEALPPLDAGLAELEAAIRATVGGDRADVATRHALYAALVTHLDRLGARIGALPRTEPGRRDAASTQPQGAQG